MRQEWWPGHPLGCTFNPPDNIRGEVFFHPDFPSRFANVVHGPAVDVGAHHTHHHGIHEIEQDAQKGSPRSHVFQEEKPASRPADTPEFLKTAYGIGDRTEDERGKDRIEAVVREGQGLHVHFQEIHVLLEDCGHISGALQHLRTEIDGCDVNAGGIVRQVLSRAYTRFEGPVTGYAVGESFPPGSKPGFLYGRLHTVIKKGQPVISSADAF